MDLCLDKLADWEVNGRRISLRYAPDFEYDCLLKTQPLNGDGDGYDDADLHEL